MRLAVGSIAVGVLVLGLKLAAWWLTGSVALYSDALESIVNVAAAVAALVAIRLSAKPADRNHPYGHHKAEYFSAVIEGVLIILAALSIAHAAYGALSAPHMPDFGPVGLAVNALASVINGVWAAVLIRAGRTRRSPALAADGRHLLTDVVSSVGVLAGVLLAALTGWLILDPVLALLVALNILWSGWQLVKSSVSGLMDEAVAPEELGAIRAVISRHADGALEAHDLRTRQAGRVTFIDFHLVVPGEMTVCEAHEICDRIEGGLRAAVGEAVITIHVEPEDKAKHTGVLVL
ncbi:cation diffusion facilitator family transporter [Salinarimonas rosea]|uniref:cation diffusion facilitator family transporter n=1 Tax=Salinarimonas rosea TaxID=552063 RepID=UPI0005BC3261|nr:cation diffusion facilitator family transporter [Salinarimonas rosea]